MSTPNSSDTQSTSNISTAISARRQKLEQLRTELATRYWAGELVETLVTDLTRGTDELIIDTFNQVFGTPEDICLYAVGGYGRGELHPWSDIDLLLVAKKPQQHRGLIESFFQDIFDLNIEVGHSVRTPRACRDEAKNDLTVATALFERRLLCGDERIATRVDDQLTKRVWPSHKFFTAKRDEQIARHKRSNDVDYNLEPNVKSSPGGMRDIHTAQWICLREYGTSDPYQLEALGVLTAIERQWLVDGKSFLWWVRFGLHLLAGRKEDQLQFAMQRELAERHGFVDTEAMRGVERFMRSYYRHVQAITEVSDILLQHFQETVKRRRWNKTEKINERFRLKNEYLEVTHDQVFADEPAALLELFVIMANRTDVAGVRVDTIRLIRDHLHLIDDKFRNEPHHQKLFIDLLKAPYTLVSQLTRMRRYGILGRYIPEFGQVIGQMQHDLFHIYTVDAHTMMVLRKMRQFRYRSSREAFPTAHDCVHRMPKIELLYLAGLFHDIGKGRGGDHSALGAIDAQHFCERHGLSEADTDLVCWLVKKHLHMSAVAQRQDIHDPDVVHKFASEVKSEMRLDYLYSLTVADINATNPTLWNDWRATLLQQLYTQTRDALRRGLESPADKAATVAAFQERALESMPQLIPMPRITQIWGALGSDFFLRHSPAQIATLTMDLANHDEAAPFVKTENYHSKLVRGGATRVYVYTPDRPRLFADAVTSLSQLGLRIVEAAIHTGANGYCMDMFTVLAQDGSHLAQDDPIHGRIVKKLKSTLARDGKPGSVGQKRVSRQMRELQHPTEVSIVTGPGEDSSTLTVVASDRPGLLAIIAEILVDLGVQVLSARIATLGERVEDLFQVRNQHDQPIAPGQDAYELSNAIRQRIDHALSA